MTEVYGLVVILVICVIWGWEKYISEISELSLSLNISEIHSIYDLDVKDSPTFKELANDIKTFIGDSDLCGFNSNKFDIPILEEEFLRAGLKSNFESKKLVDVQNIFHKKEQRNLSAAYEFYCNKELIGAHSAESDTKATYEILKAQVEKYDDLENNISFLSNFSTRSKFADLAGFIVFNEKNQECFSFGKHKGKLVLDILKTDSGYFNWLLNADFPLYTKNTLKSIKLKLLNNKLS